jgi:IclR family KDG regulon transcriptional repressor
VLTALDPPRRSADTSTSVGKALSMLDAFLGSSTTSLGVSEIARRASVAKSTAHRLLIVLESHGLVRRIGDRWLPGTQLFRIGNAVSICRPRRLRDQALPHMQHLYVETHAMVSLAVLHQAQVLCVEKLASRETIDSPATVGGCLPLHSTALGKAMLAYSDPDLFDSVVAGGLRARTTRTITSAAVLAGELAQIRRVGFALDQQETTVGLVCAAVPILREQRVIGAISLSLDVRRGLPQQHVPRLRRVAEAIAGSLVLDD